MSKPDIPDNWGPLIPGSRVLPTPAFGDIVDDVKTAVARWSHLRGFTFNPKTGHIFDVEVEQEGMALYRELVECDASLDPSRPIYVIAVTCHKSMVVDLDLKKGYDETARLSNSPLIGCWFHAGEGYLDASFPAQFINNVEALEVGRHYEQDYILRIKPDKKAAIIQTH